MSLLAFSCLITGIALAADTLLTELRGRPVPTRGVRSQTIRYDLSTRW